jgi:GT2 family glycosyltransferase
MGEEPPFFSIIVPTYDRPGQLATCLHSLSRLDYRRDRFQVIVVDDGSKIPLEVAVASFNDRLDVTLLTQPQAGPATARNTGVARAKGDFLVFTDDDCAPTPDWLRKLAACFGAAPDRGIVGRTLNTLPDNLYSTASQLLIDYLCAYYNADPNQAHFITSNNLAVPADSFHAIGGFDMTFPRAGGEDREFCDRWLHHGYRMTYAKEVLVYHNHGFTFHAFWRQHFNYGRGAFRFHHLRAQRGSERIRLEPFSFYQNLLRYPLSQAPGWRALLFAVLLVVSQAANAAGFFWEKLHRDS